MGYSPVLDAAVIWGQSAVIVVQMFLDSIHVLVSAVIWLQPTQVFLCY